MMPKDGAKMRSARKVEPHRLEELRKQGQQLATFTCQVVDFANGAQGTMFSVLIISTVRRNIC